LVFKVRLFTPKNKISPIKEFLDDCSPNLRTKILRQLKYVEEYGLNPAIPNIKKISGTSLWELRILGKDNVRIFCLSLPNEEVKILHILNKKKQKTPARELNIALKRSQEVLDL